MGVSPVAGEGAEHDGAHDRGGSAPAIAGVVKGALAQKLFPTPPGLEELEEENELALAGDGGLVIPLGVKTPARGVQRPGAGGVLRSVFGLTLGVSRNQGRMSVHALVNTTSERLFLDAHFPF